jgi:hypothetical protein
MIRKVDPPDDSFTWWLGEASTTTSELGSSRTMLARRFTGSVTDPVSFTSALILHRMPRSRFVVVSDSWSFSASISTLLRMGIVAFDPTTLRTWDRPLAKWSRFVLNFMGPGLRLVGKRDKLTKSKR